MMMMVRDRGYAELVRALEGRRVRIWTCGTCARLCGVGGPDRAADLASALRRDGVDVTGVSSVSAGCLESKVSAKAAEADDGSDLVLGLLCSIGAGCARRVLGKEVLNPVDTVGFGYADADGALFVCGPGGARRLDADGRAGPYARRRPARRRVIL